MGKRAGNEIILNPPKPIDDVTVTTEEDAKQTVEDKKTGKPRKKPLHLIRSLMVLTLIGVTITEIYFRVDKRFKEHQNYINENFSESVTLMVAEYEEDSPVRGIHDIKDPFEGWERYSYHSLSFRYPPEFSTQYTLLHNHGCAHSSSHIDFTSSEFRQLHSGITPTGTGKQIALFYEHSFGMTMCHFQNTGNLDLIDFVLAKNTWLPDTTKYNGDSDRSRITRNWINANVDRTLEGYIFEGGVTTDKPTTILFLKERDDTLIYIFELDQNYVGPGDETAEGAEELRDVFDRILTSINWRVR